MNQKGQAEKAQGVKTAQTTPEVKLTPNPYQERLQSFAALEKMVKQHKNLQFHFDQLTELEITKPLNEFEEGDKKSVEKITIDLGNNDDYEIKNPTLIELVRNFLKSTLQLRMADLEKEIMAASI